jgi:hypothetical protein
LKDHDELAAGRYNGHRTAALDGGSEHRAALGNGAGPYAGCAEGAEADPARMSAWNNTAVGRQWNKRWLRNRRKACRKERICVECVGRDAMPGIQRCERCAEQHRDREDARAFARYEAGLCRRCGVNPRGDKSNCAPCRERHAARMRGRNAAKRCPICGYAFDDKTKRCPKCAEELK